MSLVNPVPIMRAILEGKRIDPQKLLSAVDPKDVTRALRKTKAGVPRQIRMTDKPLEEPRSQKMGWMDKQKLRFAFETYGKHPEMALPILHALREKYPNVPRIYNYIWAAYAHMGRDDERLAVLEEAYAKFPDYLFVKTGLAECYLKEGHHQKIPELFDRKYELHLLYPEIEIFHVSQVRAFLHIFGIYFARINQVNRALYHYFGLMSFAPKDTAAEDVANEILWKELQKIQNRIGKNSAVAW